jgi:hypothetical protein
MAYLAVLLALVGIVMAWLVNRKNNDLKERLAQANSRVYTLRREFQEKQEKFEQDLLSLRFEVLKSQGNLKVTPETRIDELSRMHPQALQVLAGFHLGGCASCSVDDRQTLTEAAGVNGRELEPILVALNTLIAESSKGNVMVSPERLKTPNIQLHI